MAMSGRGKPSRGLHKIQQKETPIMARDLRDMEAGDVVIREGTPVMVCKPETKIDEVTDTVLIVNLTNGSCWWASGSDQVWPAINIQLSYDTLRRG